MTHRSLVLASKSASRKAMLDAAGVSYRSISADIDERAIEQDLVHATASEIAEALSIAKATEVARRDPEPLVLGSDSLVVVEGKRFDKPTSRENAAEHLAYFSGKIMELHSAAALVQGNICEWTHTDCARLYVRDMSDEFIEQYLQAEWPEIGQTVGCFRIEAMGVQLFDRIDGDQFTVLGMPLFPVLEALRKADILAT